MQRTDAGAQRASAFSFAKDERLMHPINTICPEAPHMPFFDYHCRNCDHRFEVLQKINEPALSTCPSCDQDRLEKLLSAPAVQSSGGGGHVHGPGCRH